MGRELCDGGGREGAICQHPQLGFSFPLPLPERLAGNKSPVWIVSKVKLSRNLATRRILWVWSWKAVIMKGSMYSTATWGWGQFLEGAEHHLAAMSASGKALSGLSLSPTGKLTLCVALSLDKTVGVSGSQLNFNLTFFTRWAWWMITVIPFFFSMF